MLEVRSVEHYITNTMPTLSFKLKVHKIDILMPWKVGGMIIKLNGNETGTERAGCQVF